MSKKEEYESKFEKMVQPVCDRFNYELVDVEYVKEGSDYYLRAYIDKEGGITIDDLVEVNHILSDQLDAEDFIPDAYILEVSSPGLGRQLKKEKDFVRSVGKQIDVKLYKAIDKRKESSGMLKENTENAIVLDEEGNLFTFEKKDISMARLTIDF